MIQILLDSNLQYIGVSEKINKLHTHFQFENSIEWTTGFKFSLLLAILKEMKNDHVINEDIYQEDQ